MKESIGFIGAVILIAVLLGALIALPIMWLWNHALVGAISGVNEISYLQAWGIYVLCNALIKTNVEFKK